MYMFYVYDMSKYITIDTYIARHDIAVRRHAMSLCYAHERISLFDPVTCARYRVHVNDLNLFV